MKICKKMLELFDFKTYISLKNSIQFHFSITLIPLCVVPVDKEVIVEFIGDSRNTNFQLALKPNPIVQEKKYQKLQFVVNVVYLISY